MTDFVMPAHREFTIEDLDGFPADGNRYELIEGALHVSPAPVPLHQRVAARLAFVLETGCPPGLDVLSAPLDTVLGPSTLVQPDIVVLRVEDIGPKRIETPPVLVVEVLSPSTRLYDTGTKRLTYRDAGIPAYWVVDPNGPSITEHRWEGADELVRTVTGEEAIEFDHPYPLTVVPAELMLAAGDRRREP